MPRQFRLLPNYFGPCFSSLSCVSVLMYQSWTWRYSCAMVKILLSTRARVCSTIVTRRPVPVEAIVIGCRINLLAAVKEVCTSVYPASIC